MCFPALRGLASLHLRGLAMQDVSLENMLLFVDESSWQVRVGDPGQAVAFVMDPATGQEPIRLGFGVNSSILRAFGGCSVGFQVFTWCQIAMCSRGEGGALHGPGGGRVQTSGAL